MATPALDRAPNFQSTLRHELGHAFGLVHVDVYKYDMKTNRSVMAYNSAHRTNRFQESRTPAPTHPGGHPRPGAEPAGVPEAHVRSAEGCSRRLPALPAARGHRPHAFLQSPQIRDRSQHGVRRRFRQQGVSCCLEADQAESAQQPRTRAGPSIRPPCGIRAAVSDGWAVARADLPP